MYSAKEKASFRIKQIKKGKHYRDVLSESNNGRYDISMNQLKILNKRPEFKNLDQSFVNYIKTNITEYITGIKTKDYNDTCDYCGWNIGYYFMLNNENAKRSCFSCKCNHISMLTKNQILRKYPEFNNHYNVFETLQNQHKTVNLNVGTRWPYNIEHTYYMIEDVEAIAKKHKIRIRKRPRIEYEKYIKSPTGKLNKKSRKFIAYVSSLETNDYTNVNIEI